MPDVITPLGFIAGKITIEGLPTPVPNIDINIDANEAGGGHHASTSVGANPQGTDYSLPLAPGNYQVLATFGSAQSSPQNVTVNNGKTTEVNFAFGK